MDQSATPLLDALVDYCKAGRYGFTPPGHRQGRATDQRVLDVLAAEQATPYPPGMNLPDPADLQLRTIKVVA